MKLFSFLSPSSLGLQYFPQYCLIFNAISPLTNAFTFKKSTSANLDLQDLGRTAFAGDFTGISLYEYEGYSGNTYGRNGNQSLFTRTPDGRFVNVASSDASIQAMCLFQENAKDGSGVVVGGDFTDLGGVQSSGAAFFNPNTSVVHSLTGLSGQVSALLCDQTKNQVYAGGSFKTKGSINAAIWTGTDGWKDLPFGGFNGPVTSIIKAPNGNIIYGGSFTGLGTASGPILPDQRLVNIKDAEISAGPPTSNPGYSDPRNIICKGSGTDGPGNAWLLADNSPGLWRARLRFTFQPTRLRIWNTNQDGRGTKTFRYTAFPINGIMNFSYIDPVTNNNSTCSSECPLSRNTILPYQDFYFVNVIGMNAFQIDISDWYGNGGGLAGIELSQNEIESYAINEFNEPRCSLPEITSTVTVTGPWTVSPSTQSSSDYLTATVTSTDPTSITFQPNIRQSGNYSVNIYTPGCIQDNSCAIRGRVRITGLMSKGNHKDDFSTEIYQTNNYDKYDQIYFGYIDASSSLFKPSVTIKLASGQDAHAVNLVAQRLGFTLVSQSGGLNGLFEYDPNEKEFSSINSTRSPFIRAGMDLVAGAQIYALTTIDNATFVGGNFTKKESSNLFKVIGQESQPVFGNGLNGQVETLVANGSMLLVGGSFSGTAVGRDTGLANVAIYDTSKNLWSALGAGVNGPVKNIVLLPMNITHSNLETTVALSGDFTQVLGFGNNPPFSANGLAIWVPSFNNWLQNLQGPKMKIDGDLVTSINLADGSPLFAGSVASSQLSAADVAKLDSSGSSINPFQIKIDPQTSQNMIIDSNNSLGDSNSNGVNTGIFHSLGNRNLFILGGHFKAIDSNGTEIHNLAFIEGDDDNAAVTGIGSSLSSNSTIHSMSIHDNILFAGGLLNGLVNGTNVRGLVSYNFLTSSFGTQPPSLDGDVYAVSSRRTSNEVYVGGNFTSAGSLSCPAVCQYSTTISQWNRPGIGIGGVAYTLLWANPSALIVGGSLTLNGKPTPLVTFNTKSFNWTVIIGSERVPGPVRSIAKVNAEASQLWVSGLAVNGTTFLMKFDGHSWTSISHLLGTGTYVRGLQVLGVTSHHASSSLVTPETTLLITGFLNLPGFGFASAALFNGTIIQPFILTSLSNSPGSLSELVTEKDHNFQSKGNSLRLSTYFIY